MISILRKYLLKLSMPFVKRIGMMHLPYTRKKVKAKQYHEFFKAIVPGTVLLAKTYGEASNLVVPGRFKHGAIYAGNGIIIEALSQGVTTTDLIDFMLSKDEVAAFMPEFCDVEVGVIAAKWALRQVGLPYDYEFKSGNKAFYCFELTFSAYMEAMNGKSPWELRKTWGEPTVIGDDFLKATNKWTMILDSRKIN